MPRNGSGTYARAGTAYVYNTIIDQVAVNAEMDDIATALTASLAKDGQTVPTANLPMGGYKLTGLGDATTAGDAIRFNGAAGTPTSLVGTNITGTAASLTAGTANAVPFIPSGTKMLFQQTAAPTGWTKDTTHNDKALRVVSGAAGSGGTTAFSTIFAKTATDSHTLSTDEIPAHQHTTTYTTVGSVLLSGGGASAVVVSGGAEAVSSVGGGGGHTHGMDIRVQYVDLIIATRN